MPTTKAELLQGTLDLLILKTLSAGPLHGYAIAQHIQQRTEDILMVEEGSLYPALYRMEGKGWIEAEWGKSENNRRAKFYKLTKPAAGNWRKKPRFGSAFNVPSRWYCKEPKRRAMKMTSPKQKEIEEIATRIGGGLREIANPRKAEAAQRFFSGPIQALGIDTPTMRKIARNWIRQLTPTCNLSDACVLCDRLAQDPYIETRAMGFLVLAGFRHEFAPSLFHQAEHWLFRYFNNWALVDGFAGEVLSPLLRRHPECIDGLRHWTQSKCMWVRRAAVVTLVPFARRGEYLDLAFELAEGLFRENEDLMHKAVGWLLREAGKTNPRRLRTFLLRHHGTIPRTTVRYAIERFPAEERQRLLEQTRPQVLRNHNRGQEPPNQEAGVQSADS